MENEFSEAYKKSILRLALFLGELMLINGAETFRVEDTILRICTSRGFNHINVFASPTVIIIADYRFDGYSFMKTIKARSIDLNKISLLNNFSRKFVANTDIPLVDAMRELKDISSVTCYSPKLTYLSTGLGSAFFACLLGGNNISNFISTIITSILAVILYKKIMKLSSISAFSSLAASTVIASIGLILTQLHIIVSPTTLIVGSIMPLLPGVSFIKGIRDLISGDLISGVARSFDACVTAVSIACGVGIILNIWISLGGNL